MRRRRRYRGRHRKDRTLPLGTLVIVASAAAGVYLTAAPGGASAAPTTVFVAPNGSDGGGGTRSAPYRTIEKAISVADAGTTIRVRGGTYYPRSPLSSETDGTRGRRVVLTGDGPDPVVVDGARLSSGPALLSLRADYWTVSDIEFRNAPGAEIICSACEGFVFRESAHR
ncbi:DUF1565 domain-containing protein [Streptomyces sp. LX-29]|uniref:DUF1565 domain-containing protein n=1 Tax=Streptomyces sp. LX-29 TaxID=2900152 RepID=UPI00240E9755|nr:DUF1565 domain-containing protein [Streptomyces sp. LX-29]WFB10167.1 DUF1565 domain-containing protein [Streptomyces sp. LX-29]